MPTLDDSGYKQIEYLHRRRNKLLEKQAQLGVGTDPVIEIEIEDIESKIAQLEAELEGLSGGEIVRALVKSRGWKIKGIRAESINIGLRGCSVTGLTIALAPFIIIGLIGYYYWIGVDNGGEAVLVGTPTFVGVIVTPPTSTPTHEIASMPSSTPISVSPGELNAPTVTLTPTNTFTPIPIPPTLTPTDTPTPTPVTGTVNVGALNVRRGTSTQFGYVGAVYEGDEVVILGRNSIGDWLQIVTPDQRIGWVAAKFITIDSSVSSSLAVVPTPPTAAEAVALAVPRELEFNRQIDIEGRSVADTLGPYEEHWYTFFEYDPQTVVVFIFDPNINFSGVNFVGYNVEFFLYDEGQVGTWPPGNADSLPHIGSGQADPSPKRDRDGDLRTGELVWRGGPLVPGVLYYLRFVNHSAETLEYCLAPGDVYEWTCTWN